MDFNQNLNDFYNKFNEDKRLLTRHGQIEFQTTITIIEKYLKPNMKILDIGAGSARYSMYFKKLGYDVCAIELSKSNIGKIRSKYKDLRLIEADAKDLRKLKDEKFDIILLFGPMYHLQTSAYKLKAINEAKLHLNDNGYIFIAYLNNEYAILKHGFINHNFEEENEFIDSNFKVKDKDELYSYVTLNEIDEFNKETNLKSVLRFSQCGLSNYFRKEINQMSENTFINYIKYHIMNCERYDMLGYSSHIVDVVKKDEI